MTMEFGGLTPLIQVFDMPASMRFYCDVLGFRVVETNAGEPPYDWMLLQRNNDEIMLNTMYEADDRPPATDPARTAPRSARRPRSPLAPIVRLGAESAAGDGTMLD